ncbi:hypothetical protein LTS16_007910 [Friedmanniomyces endolithicus]|nr:hypothetical protein LTS16_007910 [Friedmanniomyces endolithicus]
MSRSDDPGHYFQTTDSLATSERKAAKANNNYGDPRRLSSKILAVLNHQSWPGEVIVAEAAGVVRRVNLSTSTARPIARPRSSPLTSLAIAPRAGVPTLYAACWDKLIYGTPLPTSNSTLQSLPAYQPHELRGHSDFVKCLLPAQIAGSPVLLSGGADGVICVWDLASVAGSSGKPLHKLSNSAGGKAAVQCLVLDPLGVPPDLDEPSGSGVVVFSSSSDREIRRWFISRERAYELAESIETPILAHETSVYKLCFDSEGDLWTASADGTAKHLVRERGWEVDTVLKHPDFVRDVVVDDARGMVVTACRDEEVRLWDAGSGDLVCVYGGHYEEVTGLALVEGWGVVSVSIDGTVRRWSLERKGMREYAEAVEREKAGMVEEGKAEGREGVLTAEEEAELAELMDDDD